MGDLLYGRVALVTGASHGIGRETAVALAREGANLIICARNSGRLLDLMLLLKEEGVVRTVTVDATDPRSVRNLFDLLSGDVDRLDILVNNVGGAEKFGGFFDLTDEDWLRAYQLNFMSMVYFTREAVPWLRKSPYPRIINISSLPAKQPGMFNPHYSAAKAAMLNLNKHLANTLAKDNILVNAICPSTLKGGGWERNARDRAERQGISLEDAEKLMEAEEIKKVPLGRIGTPVDVAELVVFLASDRANFITGTCINVDGGIGRSML